MQKRKNDYVIKLILWKSIFDKLEKRYNWKYFFFNRYGIWKKKTTYGDFYSQERYIEYSISFLNLYLGMK